MTEQDLGSRQRKLQWISMVNKSKENINACNCPIKNTTITEKENLDSCFQDHTLQSGPELENHKSIYLPFSWEAVHIYSIDLQSQSPSFTEKFISGVPA